MANTAANLVDRVLPAVPVRQWVLSAPFELRLVLARRPELLGAMVRIFVSEVGFLTTRLAEEREVRGGKPGAVACLQLFGGSLNLNPHVHVAHLDGVYSTSVCGTKAVFTPTRAPTAGEIARVCERVHHCMLRLLNRKGWLGHDASRGYREPEPIEACAQLSLRLGELGSVDQRGRIQSPCPDDHRFERPRHGRWSAQFSGWNVHAGVRIDGDDIDGREKLCRYMLRHPLSLQRMSLTTDGRIGYALKYPRGPNRTHLLLEPVKFLARLASLIPPPRRPLTRYFGVLSSASRWRDHVVPKPTRKRRCHRTTASANTDGTPTTSRDASRANNLVSVREQPVEPTTSLPNQPSQPDYRGSLAAVVRSWIPWAELLRRVFGLDALRCVSCNRRLEPIAVITEPEVVRAILDHLGLPSTPPQPARARDPTWDEPTWDVA